MRSSSGVGARERILEKSTRLYSPTAKVRPPAFFFFWEGAEDEEAVDVLFTDGSMVEDRGSLGCNGR